MMCASVAAMLAAHMDAAAWTEDDRNALLFAAPSGGALRYTNWLRHACMLFRWPTNAPKGMSVTALAAKPRTATWIEANRQP